MSPFPLCCPSCDHGNPAGSNFCNNCGMPVHFETCSHCEAINRRGAHCCHQCRSPLPVSPESLSRPATAVAFATAGESSVDSTVADLDVLSRYPATDVNDAKIDDCGASTSSCAEHVAASDETMAPLCQPAGNDVDVHAEHADSQTARRRSLGLALAVVMLVALAVPAYVAYEDSAQFSQAIDATTPTLNGPSNPHALLSAQTVPAKHPVAEAREATPLLQDSATRPREPSVDATQGDESQRENVASAPPPPLHAIGDTKTSTPDASTALPSGAAKTVRKSGAKSNTSKSKPGASSRKPASRKPPDARARAMAAPPAPAPAPVPSTPATLSSPTSRD